MTHYKEEILYENTPNPVLRRIHGDDAAPLDKLHFLESIISLQTKRDRSACVLKFCDGTAQTDAVKKIGDLLYAHHITNHINITPRYAHIVIDYAPPDIVSQVADALGKGAPGIPAVLTTPVHKSIVDIEADLAADNAAEMADRAEAMAQKPMVAAKPPLRSHTGRLLEGAVDMAVSGKPGNGRGA